MSIFVDTGAFYALADSGDKHHQRAKTYYTANVKSGLFLTSDDNFQVFLNSSNRFLSLKIPSREAK